MKSLFALSLAVSAALVACSSSADQPRRGEYRPDGPPIQVEDPNPCADTLVQNESTEFLEEHVVAFYSTAEQADIAAIRVRLTCEFRESGMPPRENYPVMSRPKFERLLLLLDKREDFGDEIGDSPASSVTGHLIIHSRRYQHARVVWAEFNCETSATDPDPGTLWANVIFEEHNDTR